MPAGSLPLHVCFVCTGNICRSPTAEVVLRAQLVEAGLTAHVEVSSTGLGSWHVGDGADPRALATMSAHGYDGSGHVARQWSPYLWDEVDLVVALDRSHLRALEAQAPPGRDVSLLRDHDRETRGQHLDVPDPYYDDDGFEEVLGMVERACAGLLDELRVLAGQYG